MLSKTCSKCGITAPLDAFNRKKKGKYGRSAECKSCSTARYMKWARENPQAAKNNVRRWVEANAERHRAQQKQYREQNSVQMRDYHRSWRSKHPGYGAERKKQWYENNRDRYRSYNAKRRAQIFRACPSWVDHASIIDVYEEAVRLTQETGLPHEVDHIVPLQNKNVCGLHVPWNLQVLPKTLNRAKSNKHEQEEPREAPPAATPNLAAGER